MDTSRLIVVRLDLKRSTDLATTSIGREILYSDELHKHTRSGHRIPLAKDDIETYTYLDSNTHCPSVLPATTTSKADHV